MNEEWPNGTDAVRATHSCSMHDRRRRCSGNPFSRILDLVRLVVDLGRLVVQAPSVSAELACVVVVLTCEELDECIEGQVRDGKVEG